MVNQHNDHLDLGTLPDQTVQAIRHALDRSNQPLDLTAGNETIGVVLSPATYERLRAAEDAEMIRLGHQECLDGKGRPADEVFAESRAKLMAALKPKD